MHNDTSTYQLNQLINLTQQDRWQSVHVSIAVAQEELPAMYSNKQTLILRLPVNSLLLCGYWVCKPAHLVPVPSQDKVGGLWQEGHPA